MKRMFSDLPDDLVKEADQLSFLERLSGSRGIDWAELLKSDRILIISVAGAGKTFECQLQQRSMWELGEAAFFLELAQLATNNLRDMLSPQEEARFDTWLSAQSETATFFLDSYDELQLTLGSFRLALTRLAKAIAGQLGRARVVITSRPIPIEGNLFREILPVPEAIEDQATDEAFADLVMNGRNAKTKEEGPAIWRDVALMPLTDEQIEAMAQQEGVADTATFMADIKRRNAEEFARLPQDLIGLCADWSGHGGSRKHLDQVKANIAVKLAARPGRNERASLSLEKAINGASRLALAALLTRKLTLRHSAAADRDDNDNVPGALDPASILPDWSVEEWATLLERPLFGFASYGRVRFHHRSVIEYLAAERIKQLVSQGMAMKAAKRLLFATTAQGEDVVKPSMRPVAAWMALAEDSIFEEVRRREPSTLLNHGDPESLRSSQRIEILREFVRRYGAGGWRGLQVPWIQIHRFAAPDLAAELQNLWDRGIENPEVREIVLNIIEAGGVVACADIAYGLATQATSPERERIDALSALAALRDNRLNTIVELMTTDLSNWPDRIAFWTAIRLFPDQISIERLGHLLARISEKSRSAGDLSSRFTTEIENAVLSADVLTQLREILVALVMKDRLTWEDHWSHIVTTRQFLLPMLAIVCLRQLRQQTLSDEVIRASVLALRLIDQSSPYGTEKIADELRQVIATLPSKVRQAIFEAEDDLLQSLRPVPESAERFMQIAFHGTLRLNPEQDADWVTTLLLDRKLASDKRALMLEVASRLWDGSGDRNAYLASLKPMVADLPALVAILDTWSQPPLRNVELEKLEAEYAVRVEEAKRRSEKAHASWMAFWREVAEHPDTVFTGARAEDTAWNLWRAMEQSGDESRASGWNRRFIEKNFGRETADRLRVTLMAMWRNDHPTLSSERDPSEKNITLVKWQLGLAAIAAEAEDPSWATKLTEDEARLAARYAPLELNRFPSWLDSLVIAYPSCVESILGNELSLELAEPPISNASTITLQNIDYASPAVAAIFTPRLENWLTGMLRQSIQLQEMENSSHRIERVIRILLKNGDTKLLDRLHANATNQLANRAHVKANRIWLPILMRFDPAVGIDVFEKILAPLPVEACGEAVEWFGSLFNERYGESTISLSSSNFTPMQLFQLTRLAYQHVRMQDNVEHEGAYSPGARDHAEGGRNALLTALLNTKGVDGWRAKLLMIDDPLFAHFKDRAISLARESAAEESDGIVASESDVLSLNKNYELPPGTIEDMFALLVDRLDDLDDLLLQDDSPRAAWSLITEEFMMRQVIAHELKVAARSAYTVDQEAATADNKETDIRLRSASSDQQAVIELKIGEKPRSGAELKATLREQLVKKYMAPHNTRSGCLLITVASDRRWQHPDTGASLDLAGLILMLNEEAQKIQQEIGGELRLFAKGLDLTARLPAEKAKIKRE